MKGLLLKDWYLTLKYGRVLIILTVVYGVIGVFSEDFAVFAMLPVLLIAMLPNTLYAYDEREKWTTYVQAFPISRAQYVTGKYLFGILALAVYFALLTILHLAAGTQGLAELMTILISAGLLSAAVMMPLMFALGVEKGRIAYYIMIGAMVVLGMMLTRGGRGVSSVATLAVPEWTIVLVMAALYLFSWRLSIALYQKRVI